MEMRRQGRLRIPAIGSLTFWSCPGRFRASRRTTRCCLRRGWSGFVKWPHPSHTQHPPTLAFDPSSTTTQRQQPGGGRFETGQPIVTFLTVRSIRPLAYRAQVPHFGSSCEDIRPHDSNRCPAQALLRNHMRGSRIRPVAWRDEHGHSHAVVRWTPDGPAA